MADITTKVVLEGDSSGMVQATNAADKAVNNYTTRLIELEKEIKTAAAVQNKFTADYRQDLFTLEKALKTSSDAEAAIIKKQIEDLKMKTKEEQLAYQSSQAARRLEIDGLKQMGGATDTAGKSNAQFAQRLQGVSFQMQDLIVQTSGGVDIFKALGQQLPQMLVGFGAMGAVIGVVTALLPAIVDGLREYSLSLVSYKKNLIRWLSPSTSLETQSASLWRHI